MQTDLEKLERLHALFVAGALSGEEYEQEKARLLSPSAARPAATETGEVKFAGAAGEIAAEEEHQPINRAPSIGVRVAGIAVAACLLVGGAFWFGGSGVMAEGRKADTAAEQANPAPPSASPDISAAKAASLPPKAMLLGKPYGDALRGKPFDPALGLTTEGYFSDTLSGPQTPGVSVKIKNKEVLVWENCQAHNCPWSRSIIAVEIDGPARFVATIVEGEPEILRNAWFGAELLAACGGATCDFGAAAQPTQTMGKADDIGTLGDADLAWAYGGAHCRAENPAGDLVFYTEGEGVIRFKGKLHKVSEDGGIGAGPWSSEEGFDSIIVEIEERNGPTRELEEGSSYPAYLKVFDGSYTSIPVTMTCEA